MPAQRDLQNRLAGGHTHLHIGLKGATGIVRVFHGVHAAKTLDKSSFQVCAVASYISNSSREPLNYIGRNAYVFVVLVCVAIGNKEV